MLRQLMKPVWVFLAVVFLIEAWLWEHLAPVVAWLLALVGWNRIKATIAAFIVRLPPPAALLLFAIPTVLLIPFKLAGFYFIAHDQFILGAATYLMAKFVGLGVAAFIFDLTRDKLLGMAWFARFYHWVIRVRDWAHAQVDPIKRRIRAVRRLIWRRIGASGQFGRKLAFLRRRAFRTPASS
jgi:hypothetical protein